MDGRTADLLRLAGATRLADITGLDRLGIPVMSVVRPNGRSLSVASGKGRTPADARISALMEAVEHATAETPALPTVTAPLAEPPADLGAIDPAALPCRRAGRPDVNTPLRWAPARQLIDGAPCRVPYDLVHLDFTAADIVGRRPGFLTSTNGLAAGLERDAALLHALCEVIERDAMAVWSTTQGAIRLAGRPGIDLDAVDDPRVADLVARCRRAGVRLRAWNITADIGVPTIYARIAEGDSSPVARVPPADGAGCHPDARLALVRAITEAAQSRLVVISGVRDDLYARHYRLPTAPGDPEPPAGVLPPPPPLPPGDAAAALAWSLDRLAEAGFPNAAAVDLDPPGSGVSVVRVVVPGLEGMTLSKDYAPGPRARARQAEAQAQGERAA